MSSSSRPHWRSVVDAVDAVVTPSANKLVRTDLFADAVAAATRLEVQIRRRMQRQTGAMWSALNLPSATDQRRLHAQVASLEARIRDLTERLEDAAEEAGEADG